MPLGVKQFFRGVHPETVRGLFHGKSILAGFKCADKGKRPKTRRDWQPNVQYKFLYSEALERRVRLFVTAHTLKRIDAAGGLDMYLLTEPLASKDSIVGQQLKMMITEKYRELQQPLPAKEGATSILHIINQKLKAAGFMEPTKSGTAVDPPSAQSQADADMPGQDNKQSRSKPSTCTRESQQKLRRKGAGQPKGSRAPGHVDLTSGKRVRQELVQARAVAERQHAIKVRRRQGFLSTMQGTARNQLRVMKPLTVIHKLESERRSKIMAATWEQMQDGAEPEDKDSNNDDTPFSTPPSDVKLEHFPGRNVPCMLVSGKGMDGVYVPVARQPSPVYEGHESDLAVLSDMFKYPVGKKFHKLKKWLNKDDWLPQTNDCQLVLPNGMILWSARRRDPRVAAMGKKSPAEAGADDGAYFEPHFIRRSHELRWRRVHRARWKFLCQDIESLEPIR